MMMSYLFKVQREQVESVCVRPDFSVVQVSLCVYQRKSH